MQIEEIEDIVLRPVGMGAAEEGCDLLDVPAPLLVLSLESRFIAGLGGLDEIDRDQDVLFE
jgi:hypothetical protein